MTPLKPAIGLGPEAAEQGRLDLQNCKTLGSGFSKEEMTLGASDKTLRSWQLILAFFWLAFRTLTFVGFYMNYNKATKSLTFCRASEVSQVGFRV